MLLCWTERKFQTGEKTMEVFFNMIVWAWILYFLIFRDLIKEYRFRKRKQKWSSHCRSLIDQGESTESIFEIFFDKRVLRFGEIIDLFPPDKRPGPATLGQIARKLRVDFESKNERGAITTLTLEETITFFKNALPETRAFQIAVYLVDDWDSAISDLVRAFLSAGFSGLQTVAAFIDAVGIAHDVTYGEVVDAALRVEGITRQDIGICLAQDSEIDLDELNEEMQDAGVEPSDRFPILVFLLENTK